MRLHIILIMLVFLLTPISAEIVYSGESVNITLNKTFEYYSIVGNSTEIIFNLTQIGNNITITLDKYSKEDRFEIIFFDREDKIITVYKSSGGGSRTIYKDKNITEYVDVPNYINTTEYVDREIKVPGETIEIENNISNIPLWVWGIIIILLGVILYLVFIKKQDNDERRLEKDE